MKEFDNSGIEHSNKKRHCCRLMNELCRNLESLQDPQEVGRALETLSEHCVLMKLMGKSAVKWDMSKSECYIAFYPEEAQGVIDEISKTFAAYGALSGFDAVLFHLEGILAHNEKLKQISDKIPFVSDEIRKNEKKFGSVPETSFLQDKNTKQQALGAGDLLKAHPLLDKPQMDGASPKNTSNPVQHPDAAENAERLQHQHQLQPGQKYTYSNAPKFKPSGMGG